MLEFKWITSWDEVWSEDFMAEWEGWMDVSPTAHIFFHPAMVRAWVKTYLPLRHLQPLFCIVQSEDQTIFLPLVVWQRAWRGAWMRMVIPVGYADFDYHDPIVVGASPQLPDSFWEEFAMALARDRQGGYDQVSIAGLSTEMCGKGRSWMVEDVSLSVTLGQFDSYEAFVLRLKPKMRRSLYKERHALQELGELSYHRFTSTELPEALESLSVMLYHHTRRWQDAYKAPHFHTNLITEAMEAGVLHFAHLCLDGKPISWSLGFVYKGRYAYYMPAYDECYRAYGVGKMMMFLTIEALFGEGVGVFDLLRGAEAYKEKIATSSQSLYTLSYDTPRLETRLKSRLLKLKERIKAYR